MISLQELADCKTSEQLIDLIHLDAKADDDDWDFLGENDDEDEDRPPSRDDDACTALMREALEYAALGDLEEAKLRVRCRFHPKFNSLEESHALYQQAMSEGRV